MAKKITEEEAKTITPSEQLAGILNHKDYKEDHYNFEPAHDYKVPCSSLILTSYLGGGLSSGAHRMVGLASGGKTSCALDFMFHFLKNKSKKRRGIFIKSEGRLSKEIQERSGVKFTFSLDDWEDGTCFVFESNIFEAVFKLKRELISNNPQGYEYFFITDSADGLIKRDDAKKTEEESITVGGGSLITSVFLKKTGLAMAKRGHIDVYISQIRDQIKINPYEKSAPKQGKASGPRALEHQADVVLEFLPRFGKDLIEEDGKIIGHFCKCEVVKSNNEKNMVEIRYPIRYKQTGGKSVWTSYELADLLILWENIKKKGAWYRFSDGFREDLIKHTDKEVPELFQGLDSIRNWIDEDEKIQQYLFDSFKDLSL